jgi:hypothetical protein
MKIVADSTPLAILALREREQHKGALGRILLRLDPTTLKVIALEESSLSLFQRLFLRFDASFRLSTIVEQLLREIEEGNSLDEPSLQLLDKKIVTHNATAYWGKIEENNSVISLSARIFHPMTLSCLASDVTQAKILHDFLLVSHAHESFMKGRELIETLDGNAADLELCRSVIFAPKSDSLPKIDSLDLYVIDNKGIIKQKPDGNCLLNSFATGVSMLLGSSLISPIILRQNAMDYIEKLYKTDELLSGYIETAISEFNEDMKKHGVADEPGMKIHTISEYIERARENHFWCSIPQIYALSKLFQVCIEVYYESALHKSPFCIIPPPDACIGTIRLSYDGVHYNTYVKENR